MKKLLFVCALLVSTMGFISCSDDDDAPFDVNALEGEWYMVNWIYQDDQGKEEDNYEFNQPTENSDCSKMTISKIDGNRYRIVQYFYWNAKWHEGSPIIITLEGRSFTDEDETWTITSLDSNYLVIQTEGTDEDGNYYSKQTYRKIK